MDQYLRRVSLIVAGTADEGLELSALRIKFQVRQADVQTPNRASIRIYNLSSDTAQRIQKEFTRVVLQCGYEGGAFGVLFSGTITQVRRGRENPTDTYLDIFAADGDEALNFAIISASVTAGSTFKDRYDALAKAMEAKGVKPGQSPATDGQALPRGKAMYGMVRDHLRVLAGSNDCSYSIQNGELVMLPLAGFKPGEAVVLSAATGMIGLPEQTDEGIKVRCLINPQLFIGSQLKIDQSSVQQAQLPQGYKPDPLQLAPPNVSTDGLYKIYVIDHSGDTRAEEWYSEITCLSTNPTGASGVALGQRGQNFDLNGGGAQYGPP